jgi:hypothetical protein
MTFEFAAPVLRLESGMRFHYLPLPADVADALRAAGVKRLACSINGHSVRRAVQGRADGEQYLVVGTPLLREIGAALGDMVAVSIEPDPEPDHVDVGEEFEAALEEDSAAAARYYAMPTGQRRSLAYYVNSAKRPETRLKRAFEIAYKLRTRGLYGDTREE